MMQDDPTITRADTSWYMSRRIPTTRADATRALGEALRTGSLVRGIVPGVVVDGVRHTRPGAASGFTGRLRLGGVFGVTPVEVEVEAWSHSESTLGVRPARRPPKLRADRYFECAFAFLDRLETHLLEHVVVPPEWNEVRCAS
jgi:hypothetical protein